MDTIISRSELLSKSDTTEQLYIIIIIQYDQFHHNVSRVVVVMGGDKPTKYIVIIILSFPIRTPIECGIFGFIGPIGFSKAIQ
jgi:hypothetical protein